MKLWITPGCGGERKDQTTTTTERSQRSRCRGTTLLRGEGRGRTIVLARVVDRERVELEPAIVEVEARGVREVANGVRSVLVAGAISAEVIVVLETRRVRQIHDARSEGAQTELAGLELLTSAQDGTATMADAELRPDDQDVRVPLLLDEHLGQTDGVLVLAEVLRAEVALAAVVELVVSGLGEQGQHRLERFAVDRSDTLELRYGEGPLYPIRQSQLGVDVVRIAQRRLGVEVGEVPEQILDLLRHALGPRVAREVAVVRRHLLIGVLVGAGELTDYSHELRLRLRRLVETLGAVIVKANIIVGGLEEVSRLTTLRIFGRDQCCARSHRHHPPHRYRLDCHKADLSLGQTF